jgi:hypothetical protein
MQVCNSRTWKRRSFYRAFEENPPAGGCEVFVIPYQEYDWLKEYVDTIYPIQ